MKQVEEIKIGTLGIKIERKKIKNMYLKIKPDGEVIISAHPNISTESIMIFVKSKKNWILEKQQKRLLAPSNNLAEDEVLFLGYRLKCIRKFGVNLEVALEKDKLVIYGPSDLTEEKQSQAIENWMFKQLQRKVNQYHSHYWSFFERNGFKPIEIKYRQMKSTWGVCRPTRGIITYSKQLIHQPEPFIHYVIVHELCHLLQPNHSAKFYEAVSTLLPQWESYSKQKV